MGRSLNRPPRSGYHGVWAGREVRLKRNKEFVASRFETAEATLPKEFSMCRAETVILIAVKPDGHDAGRVALNAEFEKQNFRIDFGQCCEVDPGR